MNSFDKTLIAPCGMNCGLCMAYQRDRNKCPGCRTSDKGKAVTRFNCEIKNCDASASEFCFSCETFPCKRLKHLDKRYRTKYAMSMIENLGMIKESGMKKFLENEKSRWSCPECGGTICVHKKNCSKCKNPIN